VRSQLQLAPQEHDHTGTNIGRKRDSKRNVDVRQCTGRRPSLLQKQAGGENQMSGEDQPRGEGKAADPSLGEVELGAFAMIAQIEQERLSRGGAREGSLSLRRPAENPAHGFPLERLGCTLAARRESLRARVNFKANEHG